MLTKCPICNNTEIHHIDTMGWICVCCGTPFNVTLKVGLCTDEAMMWVSDLKTGEIATATSFTFGQVADQIMGWLDGEDISPAELRKRFVIKGLDSTPIFTMIDSRLWIKAHMSKGE